MATSPEDVAKAIYYPGIDYNENRGPQIIGVAAAFIALSFITLLFRGFSRWWTKVDWWVDDWLIVVAAVLSWVYSIIVIVECDRNAYGQHITAATPAQLADFGKQLYVLAIVYPPALTFSKLSLLALYWRIFRVTTARRPLQILAGLNIAWALAAFLVGILSCLPVKANWDTSITDKTCIDYPALFLSNEAITITFDLAVLLMPVFFIANIQRSLTQRISISITFLLGLIVTIVSALRLWRLVVADALPAMDATFTDSDAGMWATIELNVWILVASIPSLRPMAVKVYQDKMKTTNKSTGRSGSGFSKTVGLGSNERARGNSLSRAPFNRPEAGSTAAVTSAAMDARNGKPSLNAGSEWTSNTELHDLDGIRMQRDVEVQWEREK